MRDQMYLPEEMTTPPALPERNSPPVVTAKHILLINPFYPKDPHASFGKHVLTPSLALTSIAGNTPPDWSVRYWDENLLQGPAPMNPFPQVVGITVHLTFANRAYHLADYFRKNGATVILGGLHVLSCPDEALQHADSIAIGEGVQLWPEILNDIANGKLTKVYRGSYKKAYRKEPAPMRRILPRDAFLTTASLIATRGCHNRCGFCYLSTEGLHLPYQMRDEKTILEEFIAEDQPYAVFIDNNLGSKPEYLRSLCRHLAPLKKIWSSAVTIDITDDPSLIYEMAMAGCTGVFIGFESLQNSNIFESNKRSPCVDDYARRVKILHDHGIQVNGSFVLGFDHDGPDIFETTVQWIEDNKLECATFHILTPYPGTPLFQSMEEEGRILHKNWDLYDTAHVVFRPAKMDPEELYRGYAWCYSRLFTHKSIWKRRPEKVSAWPGYLGMSYLYKRSNRFWPFLIRHRLTARVWRPLVELSRQRHLKFREKLGRKTLLTPTGIIPAGV